VSADTLRHVAIIMDGNNRWAKREGKQGIMGHSAGVERIRDVLEACRRNNVEVLTVFAFSSENWRRPPKEVEALMGLFYTYLKREARRLADQGVRLKVIGNRSRFSDSLLRAIEEAENLASQGDSALVIGPQAGLRGGRRAPASRPDHPRFDRGQPGDLRIAAPGSVDPHWRRGAHQQFSFVAGRIRGALFQSSSVAGV
jgi:undecaprenyl pyrophosphate synthase